MKRIEELESNKDVQSLLNLLNTKDLFLRISIIKALARIGDSVSIPFLLSLQKDKDLPIKESATRALGGFPVCKECKKFVGKTDKYCKNCGADLGTNNIKLGNHNVQIFETKRIEENSDNIRPNEQQILDINGNLLILARVFLILYLLILGIIFQMINYPYQFSSKSFIIDFVPSSIGSGLGFGLIISIIALFRKLKNKRPTKATYINYLIISTALLLLSLLPKIRIGF